MDSLLNDLTQQFSKDDLNDLVKVGEEYMKKLTGLHQKYSGLLFLPKYLTENDEDINRYNKFMGIKYKNNIVMPTPLDGTLNFVFNDTLQGYGLRVGVFGAMEITLAGFFGAMTMIAAGSTEILTRASIFYKYVLPISFAAATLLPENLMVGEGFKRNYFMKIEQEVKDKNRKLKNIIQQYL